VEIGSHLRQRDIDDEQVEAGQHHAGTHDHKDERGRGVAPAAQEMSAAQTGRKLT
jgi:hypothetical protein